MLLKVQLTASGTASITNGDTLTPLRAADLATARALVTEHLTQMAREQNAAVITQLTEPGGQYNLCFSPDGNVTMATSDQVENALNTPKLPETTPVAFSPEPDQDQGENKEIVDEPLGPDFFENFEPNQGAPTPQITPAPALPQLDTPAPVSNTPAPMQVPTTPVVPTDFYQSPPTPPTQTFTNQPAQFEAQPTPTTFVETDPLKVSLLNAQKNEVPARLGWRGSLNRHLGTTLAPTEYERRVRVDETAVSTHWPGPRTIAVVNGKGGAGKTPTAILIAALLARYGGGGVVAFDNNPTRGTLGWRTEQGPHNNTVIELLPEVEHLLSPSATAAEINKFVHHQPTDRYDVLPSRAEALDSTTETEQAFDQIHAVLTKYYRVVVIDSGNDESSPSWLAMINKADALIVPTITRPEHAESARLLLNELAHSGQHGAKLAQNALVIVLQASKAEPTPNQLVQTFKQITRDAIGINYDPAMSARPLMYETLNPASRRAWLAAAAALTPALQ
jgi:hypothetical protein